MWFVYIFSMIVLYGISDVVSTKYVNKGIKYASFKLEISAIFFGFVICLILFLFKFGESGYDLLNIFSKHPGIVFPVTLTVVSNLLFFIAVKFVGLSISESIANTNELFTFIGFIVLNLVKGYFDGIKDILSPLKIIIIVLVIAFICILPNADNIGKKANIKEVSDKTKINKAKLIFGIVLLLLGALCDGVESIISAYYLDAGIIESIDFTLLNYLFGIVFGIGFFVFCFIKEKKVFNPFNKENRLALVNGALLIASAILYGLGVNDDPIKSNLLIILYPIVPLVLARVVLKEKHSWKSWLCISVITALTIVFVVVLSLN